MTGCVSPIFGGSDHQWHLESCNRHSRLVEVAVKASVTCRDPDDQPFIDLTVARRTLLLSKDQAVISMKKRLLAH